MGTFEENDALAPIPPKESLNFPMVFSITTHTSILNVGAAYLSEMVASAYKTSLCPNTEDHNLKYKRKRGKKGEKIITERTEKNLETE
jgi:hypothetical protein